MIDIRPAASRFSADHGWLQSNFSFSFADYYDPDNRLFGPLRVFNDDVVQPANGFGEHPHQEMEIVSIVLRGQLQHRDSMGNTDVLRPGEIQRMTAGTGIVHSEVNPSETEDLSFLQLWFLPSIRGLEPSYEQLAYDQEALVNNLLPVVSNQPASEKVARIHQDVTLYLSKLEGGKELTFEQESGRYIYVFVIEGDLTLNGVTLHSRDSARITDVTQLDIASGSGAHFMLIDLPAQA